MTADDRWWKDRLSGAGDQYATLVERIEVWARGDWLQTYTGKRFYPLSPRADEIDPVDIAHALSLLCRYGGHSDPFYSVAEHCVLMSEWVQRETGSIPLALWALLHDATEAYVIDVPRPLKRELRDYSAIEARVMDALVERFGLDDYSPLDMPPEVKDADNRILLDETAVLMPRREPWQVDALRPLGVEIRAWAPGAAEAHYARRLEVLLLQRDLDARRAGGGPAWLAGCRGRRAAGDELAGGAAMIPPSPTPEPSSSSSAQHPDFHTHEEA